MRMRQRLGRPYLLEMEVGMPKRRTRIHRLPSSFDAISLGERLRWSRGRPCIEANVEPQPESWGLVWPSWAAWAEVYGKCREAFLAYCAERPNRTAPDSERLYEAILADKDPEEVLAELRREEAENDPRLNMWPLK